MNKKEQVRDPPSLPPPFPSLLPARATALNSSERDPFTKVIAQDRSWKIKENKRESERVICQRACSGRLVSPCDTVLRRFSFGRYWCLSGLAKRGGGRQSSSCTQIRDWLSSRLETFSVRWRRIRSQDCPGPVSNMDPILGTIGLHSGHVQMPSAKRWARGGRHSPRGGRISQIELSLSRVEDGNDQAEVRSCTLAQEVWSGTSGLSTVKIWRARRRRSDCESPEGLPRQGASRKRRVRCLLPSLLRQRRATCVQ